MINPEIWKDIKGYEGLYQISSRGRVRSLDRDIEQISRGGNPYKRRMKGMLIKPGILNSGYEVVWLQKEGISEALTVHRLVAKAFIPNPNDKNDVNHLDGDKTNNELSNLEWVTRSENIKHSHRIIGRKSNGRKIKCIETGEIFNSIVEASGKTKIHRGNISHVLNGRNKKAGGFTWIYLE